MVLRLDRRRRGFDFCGNWPIVCSIALYYAQLWFFFAEQRDLSVLDPAWLHSTSWTTCWLRWQHAHGCPSCPHMSLSRLPLGAWDEKTMHANALSQTLTPQLHTTQTTHAGCRDWFSGSGSLPRRPAAAVGCWRLHSPTTPEDSFSPPCWKRCEIAPQNTFCTAHSPTAATSSNGRALTAHEHVTCLLERCSRRGQAGDAVNLHACLLLRQPLVA